MSTTTTEAKTKSSNERIEPKDTTKLNEIENIKQEIANLKTRVQIETLKSDLANLKKLASKEKKKRKTKKK